MNLFKKQNKKKKKWSRQKEERHQFYESYKTNSSNNKRGREREKLVPIVLHLVIDRRNMDAIERATWCTNEFLPCEKLCVPITHAHEHTSTRGAHTQFTWHDDVSLVYSFSPFMNWHPTSNQRVFAIQTSSSIIIWCDSILFHLVIVFIIFLFNFLFCLFQFNMVIGFNTFCFAFAAFAILFINLTKSIKKSNSIFQNTQSNELHTRTTKYDERSFGWSNDVSRLNPNQNDHQLKPTKVNNHNDT